MTAFWMWKLLAEHISNFWKEISSFNFEGINHLLYNLVLSYKPLIQTLWYKLKGHEHIIKLNQMWYMAIQIQHYKISLQVINLPKEIHVKTKKTAYLHALIRWNTVI